jgi:hypothetical protein
LYGEVGKCAITEISKQGFKGTFTEIMEEAKAWTKLTAKQIFDCFEKSFPALGPIVSELNRIRREEEKEDSCLGPPSPPPPSPPLLPIYKFYSDFEN